MTAPARSRAIILAVLAVSCLALGAVGVFSITNDAARRQAGEDAIRVALGASPGRIAARRLGGPLAAVAVGLAAGLAGGIAAGRVVSSVLHGVQAVDPLAALGVSIVLAVAGVLSAAGPAIRSARTDTMTLLRAQG